jgi:hypothetical protein
MLETLIILKTGLVKINAVTRKPRNKSSQQQQQQNPVLMNCVAVSHACLIIIINKRHNMVAMRSESTSTNLGLNVKDGHQALVVDLPDGLQLGAVHGLVMGTVL